MTEIDLSLNAYSHSYPQLKQKSDCQQDKCVTLTGRCGLVGNSLKMITPFE